MNQKKKEELLSGMFAGATFTQSVVVGVAESGARVSYQEVKEEKEEKEVTVLDNELIQQRMMNAIENCQEYFWGKSAYAVVFCLLRDEYKQKMGKTAFENMVETLPYSKKRDFTCPKGTIANAFSDNQIFNENIREWDRYQPLPRIIKLRDELLKRL